MSQFAVENKRYNTNNNFSLENGEQCGKPEKAH
jgi:hypothetical protein